MAQRLFFTAPSGQEGTQLSVHTDGQGSVRQEASAITPDDLPAGTGLPDGAYVGQPARWNGSAWVPLDVGLPLVFDLLAATDGDRTVNMSGGNITIFNQDPGGLINTLAEESNFTAERMNVQGNVTRVVSNQGARYFVTSAHQFLNADESVSALELDFAGAGGAPRAGFFDEVPAEQQSVVGGTTQDQLDSLVAAMVAFGLTVDDRDAAPAPFITRLANATIADLPTPLVIEAIPASAPSGYYLVNVVFVIRAIGGGSYSCSFSWTSSGGVGQSISLGSVAGGTIGVPPTGTQQARTVDFGTGAPFNVTFSGPGITGTPDFDISTVAQYIGPIPP